METSSTAGLAAAERAPYWNNAISDAYFPLSLHFPEPLHFQGRLTRSAIGRVHLSQLVSDPMQYERCDRHIGPTEKEDYLITVPRASSVEFRQLGRDVSCDPGGFILERGDEPYRFSYQDANDLYVLKVNKSDLSERISQPDQYCARVFDATKGAGALFVSMVQETQKHAAAAGEDAGELLSRQLLELLALAIRNERKSSESGTSSVRAAHLIRIEKFIHENICNPHLSPELIASASGISKRYLHVLFKDVNCTVSQQIRNQRLVAARDILSDRPNLAISDIAYRFGFSDQAQFSRLFKSKFKMTPTDFKNSGPGVEASLSRVNA